MPIYNAPVRDMQFILHDVLDVSASGLPGHDELDRDFTEAVLDAAGKLATDVLTPLNRVGDVEGCVLENGVVRTPDGFKAAFEAMKEGGWKRDCPSCKAEHFPRTDPVVIMLVTSGEKCLLGRQKQFPAGMWSCLAGFVEAAETIEDAVRREIFEESGIRCTDVNYYMTQPWPYPSSLMIGCTARATTEDIIVDHMELEDARWFDRAEATLMIKREHPDGLAGPHPFAIAHHLLGRWLHEGPDAHA